MVTQEVRTRRVAATDGPVAVDERQSTIGIVPPADPEADQNELRELPTKLHQRVLEIPAPSADAAALSRFSAALDAKMIELAWTQIGMREEPRGSNNNPYSRYFGFGAQQWCSDYVAWCVDQTGDKNHKVLWGYPSAVRNIIAWAEKNDLFLSEPQAGAIFAYKNAAHTGFVVEVNGSQFRTVEGNTSGPQPDPDYTWVNSHMRTNDGTYHFIRVLWYPGGHEVTTAGTYRVVNCSWLNIRPGPGPDAGKATTAVPADTLLESAGEPPVTLPDGNVWINVREPGGIVGWVNRKFTQEVDGDGHGWPDVLSVTDMYRLVRAHEVASGLDRIMVTAALVESDGNRKAHGDPKNGHFRSYGLWQLNEDGAGKNMSIEDRCDPDKACVRMLPDFTGAYAKWSAENLMLLDLAVHTYLWAERPHDYKNLACQAAVKFRERWPETAQ